MLKSAENIKAFSSIADGESRSKTEEDMRIDLNFGNVESVETSASRRTNEGTKELNRTSKHDDAVLSSGDSNVSKLTAAALAVPDVRTERVAELRSSISNGNYSIEPGAIANALMNDLF